MVNKGKPSTEDILKKYSAKIDSQIRGYDSNNPEQKQFSQSYERFRESMLPEFNRYERWCKSFGSAFKMKVGEKDNVRISRAIEIAHLNITPAEVMSFSIMVLLLTFFGGVLFFLAIWLLADAFSVGLLFLMFLLSIFLFYYVSKAPERLAMKWRLKASSQMVPAILYIVIYMKHTSNLEKAISFASEHLSPPLSSDLRKVFWDVEIGKFSTIKDSLDNYLGGWRDYSLEFVEAFHLIESSLYEPSEGRRVMILEKSLQVILDGVYDKMLKYTHNVKAPLTNIYMLGIVLPTLSMAILPLASTMMQGAIRWYHVMLLFNILIPLFVVYMTGNAMAERPGGYGESELLERNPLYHKYSSNSYFGRAILMALPFFLIGIIPLIWRYTDLPLMFGLARDYSWESIGLGFIGGDIFGIITNSAGIVSGPFGSGSLILSLFVPISIAMVFIIVSKEKTKEILTTRGKYKEVEKEFNSSLFQLGNRLGDGIPAEIAFAKVLNSTRGTETEGFFRIVNENIQQLGMNIERALFDPKRGAVIYYPSQMVATSMRILVESVKKGLEVAARSLMAISEYVKNIKKINDRLNDLLADIVSDMKSNMTFLAPLLSGIIVGLAGMITAILSRLSVMFEEGDVGGLGAMGGMDGIMDVFGNVSAMIPPYWLQVIIGIYLIEIVFILTSTLVTIKSGRDPLQTTSETGKNLKKAIMLYAAIAFIAIVALTLIGAVALAGIA